jgi:hypothetical protein
MTSVLVKEPGLSSYFGNITWIEENDISPCGKSGVR